MVDRFVVVYKARGRTEAEIVRSFLQAKGIQCEISQEAVGWIYGLGTGPLAEAEILVPSHQAKEARQSLKEFRRARHTVRNGECSFTAFTIPKYVRPFQRPSVDKHRNR
jgi:hypothetical protein